MFKKMFAKLHDKLFHWLTDEPPATKPLPYDFTRLKYEIRPGDVLLIQGRSRISGIIRHINQSPWTHAALYIGRMYDFDDEHLKNVLRTYTDSKENTQLIIEGLIERGTVLTPLSLYRHHHIRICRPIGISPEDIHKVIHFAVNALGKPYNVRQLMDLARFILPWSILPRRWGSSLFRTPSGEPEGGICSSMIAEAFSSVQFPILPYAVPDKEGKVELFHRNPYLFSPKDFDYSPYFEIIKYPLFNPHEPLPYYRRMPWTTSDLVHQDEGILSSRGRKITKDDSSQPPDHQDTPKEKK